MPPCLQSLSEISKAASNLRMSHIFHTQFIFESDNVLCVDFISVIQHQVIKSQVLNILTLKIMSIKSKTTMAKKVILCTNDCLSLRRDPRVSLFT